jgi:phosphoserine/homoserine phosphotransferase
MRGRIEILARHGLVLADIQRVIGAMRPLEGALDFLDWLRERFPVLVLSDTFYEFAAPLLAQLGRPTLFCHRLETDAAGRITGYRIRLADQKRATVQALHRLAFRVVAAGDSYNDMAMLAEADVGILFRPPENVAREFPGFRVAQTYAELRQAFEDAAGLAG